MSSPFSTITNQKETVFFVLYDTQNYVSTVTLQLSYFQASSVNFLISNMPSPGQLPQPQSFFIQAIRVIPKVTPTLLLAAADAQAITGATLDMFNLIYNSWFEFTVASKTYLRVPTQMLTAGSGLSTTMFGTGGIAAAAAATKAGVGEVANNGHPDNRNIFSLGQVPLQLDPGINFNVTLNWNAAQTLNQNNLPIEIVFEGYLSRAVQ